MDALLTNIYNYVASVLSYLQNLLNNQISYVGSWIANMVTVIRDTVAGVLNSLYTQISGMVSVITQALQTVVGNINGTLSLFINNLNTAMSSVLTRVGNALDSIVSDIGGALTSFLTKAQAAFDQIWATIRDKAADVLNKLSAMVNDITGKVSSKLAEVIATVKDWINQAGSYLANLFNSAATAITGVVTGVLEHVKGLAGNAMGLVQGVYDAIIAKIQEAANKLFGGTDSLIAAIGSRLQDIKGGFVEAASNLGTVLTEIPKDLVAQYKVAAAELLKPIADALSPADQRAAIAEINNLLTGGVGVQGYRKITQQLLDGLDLIPGIGRTFALALIMAAAVVPGFWAVGSAYGEIAKQELGVQFPFTLLSPADVSSAYRRNFITQERAIDVLTRTGLSKQDAEVVLRLSENVPAEGDVIAMRLRGLLDDQGLKDALFQRGYTPYWQGKMLEAAQIIPPPSDLILMAVREAFDPAAIQAGGLDQGFPKEFGDWAAKQGLSAEWAQRYWMAHWSLPSPSQGFEMLHRGFIDKAQLLQLLTALDIAPAWRERLMNISYNVPGRVDVRRMHQLGVMSDAETQKAYEAMGYSPADAQRLLEFTIRLNKHAPQDDDEELGRLSRDTVLGFFEDGLVPEPQAITLLQGMGITREAAFLYVEATKLKVERRTRRLEKETILDQADVGALTFDEAHDALTALGLTTQETADALTDLVKRAKKKIKLPTRAEGQRFFQRGLITKEEYLDLLLRLGYSERWAQAFVADATMGGSDGATHS